MVRSSTAQKLAEAVRMVVNEGFGGLARKARESADYHLDSKWDFVYMEFQLTKEFARLPAMEGLIVRTASPADLPRIRNELFPEMTGEQEYDRRYFELLGKTGVSCFVAEREGRLLNYSWVFLDAAKSPLVDVPLDRRVLHQGDVYVGPVFTVPSARGFIYLQVLSAIVATLQQSGDARRIVLFVQGRNPAAVSFYKRLGFTEIANAAVRPAWARIWRKLQSRPATG